MDNKLNQQIKAINKLLLLPENKQCADCRRPSPSWASLNIGVFICINCSGCHRQLGTHISRVKSINLDLWPQETLGFFHKITNRLANEHWEKRMPAVDFASLRNNDEKLFDFIRVKYELKKFVLPGSVDPMTQIVKQSWGSEKKEKRVNCYEEMNGGKREVNGCDLIDDDCEGNDTNLKKKENERANRGDNCQVQKRRYSSVEKKETIWNEAKATNNTQCNYNQYQPYSNQQSGANEKSFYSTDAFSYSSNSPFYQNIRINPANQPNQQQQHIPHPQLPFNSNYNQTLQNNYQQYQQQNNPPAFLYAKPTLNNHPQSSNQMSFFNFNQISQTSFQGDPFQQFMK